MSEKPFGYWEYFAREVRQAGDAPLYLRFSEGIAETPWLQEMASQVRPGQPHANVLFAAVHFLLLRGAQHPLRRFYANLNNGARVEGEDPFPLFADFCEKYREQLMPLIRSRVTNTNEVGRSGTLNAAFREVARVAGAPLHLIEIGPSAGLNMIWDRYRIRYRRGTEEFLTDLPDAKLTLDVALRGDRVPPAGPAPRVASRVGLELNPVDLTNADDRDWLRALVWPDQVARFARLEAALDIYKDARPEILHGNALELLPDVLAKVPTNETVCVYHTYVVYQFSEEMRQTLHDLLTVAGLRRDVWRLSNEGRFVNNENPLTLWRYRDGQKEERLLANTHPHGAWIEWLA
ncbi:MAG TPA: DUF2332 domain-containing protein [Rhizomicrobium sp.]|nr:DUF2332 domain-containing protein [Rhizomicrobium sp.]